MKMLDDQKWKKIQSEKGEDLIIFKTRYDINQNPRNGKLVKAIILESNDATNVVAITKDKKVIMVKQYRFGIEQITLEIPGGFIDNDELPLTAAQRELSEETGFTSKKWSPLGIVPSNPVFMTSYVHHWLAEDIEKTDSLNLDEGEAIEFVALSIDEIKEQIQKGLISHPHTISALARVFPLC